MRWGASRSWEGCNRSGDHNRGADRGLGGVERRADLEAGRQGDHGRDQWCRGRVVGLAGGARQQECRREPHRTAEQRRRHHSPGWPGTAPQDLEAVAAVPNQPGRYVALTSTGKGTVLALSGRTVTRVTGFTLPRGSVDIEGFAIVRIDSTNVAVWAKRGSTTTPATVYAATYKVSTGTFGAVVTGTVQVPYPTSNVRHVADLAVSRSGRLLGAAASDPGDNGPFDSALYDLGSVSLVAGQARLTLSKPLSLANYPGHKIEAVGCSGATGLLGSDDENQGVGPPAIPIAELTDLGVGQQAGSGRLVTRRAARAGRSRRHPQQPASRASWASIPGSNTTPHRISPVAGDRRALSIADPARPSGCSSAARCEATTVHCTRSRTTAGTLPGASNRSRTCRPGAPGAAWTTRSRNSSDHAPRTTRSQGTRSPGQRIARSVHATTCPSTSSPHARRRSPAAPVIRSATRGSRSRWNGLTARPARPPRGLDGRSPAAAHRRGSPST